MGNVENNSDTTTTTTQSMVTMNATSTVRCSVVGVGVYPSIAISDARSEGKPTDRLWKEVIFPLLFQLSYIRDVI